MPYSTTPTLTRIAELEAERAALYARAAEQRWLDVREKERLRVIRAQLAVLWDLRRQEKAGAFEGAMPDNLRHEEEWRAPRGARHSYRSRRHGGHTWAQATALLELHLEA